MRLNQTLILFLSSFALAIETPAVAQQTSHGDCTWPESTDLLHTANVRARIFNNGALFWSRSQNRVYEVPRGSGVQAMTYTNLLISGIQGGEYRSVGGLWNRGDYWSGPLPENGDAPSDCARYDRMFTVSRADLYNLINFGIETDDIRDWPVSLGAESIDGDGDASTYEPMLGDYPRILGDQAIWWIMNDRGNAQSSIPSPPIGLEIRAMAFGFGPERGPLGNSTFYRYRIRNRSASRLESAYVGLFIDVDLGDFDDDYMGSDTTLGLGYYYNAGSSDRLYGSIPPAIGVMVIKGPNSEVHTSGSCASRLGPELGTTSHMYFHGDPPHPWSQPRTPKELHNYMSGRLLDGRELREGAQIGTSNYGNGSITTFQTPGDPITGQYWSEVNLDGNGLKARPSNRWSILSTGPFCLDPEEETEVVFAIVWSRGQNNLDSISALRNDAKAIRLIRDDLLTPILIEKTPPPLPKALSIKANFPNPFSEHTEIHFSLPQRGLVVLRVYNALGQRVADLVNRELDPGDHRAVFDGSGLPSGIYYARFDVEGASTSGTLVLVK